MLKWPHASKAAWPKERELTAIKNGGLMAGYGLYLGKLQEAGPFTQAVQDNNALADNMVGRKPPELRQQAHECPVEKRTGNPGNNKRQNAKTKN